ncbi:TadE family type IV pilus minor pilin [Cutibacterium sp. V947]|uniref:TadE family type IV pilus minor pilin n=1 Tax=unclassified Cutibacterium TaxID=2649671 RepID=UPI003EE023B5
MVTVEMAVSLITAALIVVTSCWVVGLIVVEDACRTTAAQVARQMARGDTASARQAQQHAPSGAQVSTTTSSGWVNVTVEVERSLGRIGPVHLRGQARSPMEPGQT